MPEKPEVITIANSLKKRILGKKITKVSVFWDNVILNSNTDEFKKRLIGQTIHDITTRGKWILFSLDDDYLIVHLRMEGRFLYRTKNDPLTRHEHVVLTLDDDMEFRYMDTRKFGKMMVVAKEEAFNVPPLSELGYEYNDSSLTKEYLKSKFQRKSLPIKTVLLDQHIIAGIGNIYDNEILFRSHISPYRKAHEISIEECQIIIENMKIVLEKAISLGGSTIRTYSVEEGVHGRFQNELMVHGQSTCPICGKPLTKEMIGGRGTFYCSNCQK